VLVIEGDYRKGYAREALLATWKQVLEVCRLWLERQMPGTSFEHWQSSWKACASHSWELFHGQGASIKEARQALAINKQQRDWSLPNWTGESSTLSSAEAVVWPRMGEVIDPRDLDTSQAQRDAREFLDVLRANEELGEAFAGENEEMSLTELVKRLVTYPVVAGKAFATQKDPNPNLKSLIPERFSRMSTWRDTELIVWFMADGDGVGDHLMNMKEQFTDKLSNICLNDAEAEASAEAMALSDFSGAMRRWASNLYKLVPGEFPDKATVVYAGGDDLFGALHETDQGKNDLFKDDLWAWLRSFPHIWNQCGQEDLTISMGLVWADSQVPQREALQHARDAEASAKARGKNRFALRLLYAGGNHLEWTCPWEWLDPILRHYTDREGRSLNPLNNRSRDGRLPSWRHLAEDLQWLHSRQAIAQRPRQPAAAGQMPERQAAHATALALWSAYFPGCVLPPQSPKRLTSAKPAGSAAAAAQGPPHFRASFEQPEQGRRFDQWLFDLGRVMAGLEKHAPPMSKTRRKAEEVPA
jgi:CRISPR-associated protein Cmr2